MKYMDGCPIQVLTSRSNSSNSLNNTVYRVSSTNNYDILCGWIVNTINKGWHQNFLRTILPQFHDLVFFFGIQVTGEPQWLEANIVQIFWEIICITFWHGDCVNFKKVMCFPFKKILTMLDHWLHERLLGLVVDIRNDVYANLWYWVDVGAANFKVITKGHESRQTLS